MSSADVFQTMNAGYVQMMYEAWRRDPASVDEEWRAAFNNGWKGVEPETGDRTPVTAHREPSGAVGERSAVGGQQASSGLRNRPV